MNEARIALYRKYRPENFDQVIGQDHIIRIFKNAVIEGKISHAYLFCGPRGTGKTSVARILAKAVNCEQRTGANPCGKCLSCLSAKEGKTLDLLEIDAASNRGIDEIRDLREKVKFSPSNSLYKVFIIDEVHMLTKEAFNALLKTLEEPPGHAIFVLATTEINKVPSTIISRCQRHDFKRIKMTDLVGALSNVAKKENIKIEDEALEMIAEASEGGLRDAISILDQLGGLALKKITVKDVEETLGLTPQKTVAEYLKNLLAGNQKEATLIIRRLNKAGADLIVFAKSLEELISKLIIVKYAGADQVEATKEQIEELSRIAEQYDSESIKDLGNRLSGTISDFKFGIQPSFLMNLLSISNLKRAGDQPEKKENKILNNNNNKSKTNPPASVKKNGNGQWQHTLMELKGTNHTLHAVMRVATPEFSEDVLMLTFPYKFHKERIEEKKNKKIVEDIVRKIYGREYQIKCQLASSQGEETKLNQAASILGGEIVEE